MDELTRERYPWGVRKHLYAKDLKNGPDHRGHYRCTCGLPKFNEVHKLPERSEDEKAEEARRLGGDGGE